MFTEDWSKHIKIDRELIVQQLDEQFIHWDNKIALRFYTIKPSGTKIIVDGICSVLHQALPHYVYGESDFQRNGELWAGLNASGRFGFKNPQTDGKYGELLLFVLVESILGCKMIAHKIRSLTNVKDQIKGGDGIFIGNYLTDSSSYPAYLIGESKVTTSFSTALKESLSSIERFHDYINSNDFLGNELIIAKEFIKVEDVDLMELYDRLTPTAQAFKDQVLVHPILLMYATKRFHQLELDSPDPKQLSKSIRGLLKGKEVEYIKRIKEEINKHTEVKKVYLDFFILPCNSVDEFRNLMYHKIHGAPYQYSSKKEIVDA